MLLHNKIIIPDILPDTAERIAFNKLNEGDNFQHVPGGPISEVTEHKPKFRTVRRHDGWLLHHEDGCFVWDKLVIKVTPLRK
ncbi:hypothetical protein [Mucilaginibacter sp. SP1R1]|uniref:hypothetical protein n=1 Tax=Mucilaginibacter sp. SP1R1 TaxID=2723091 RepID=UPI00161CECB0|nr:hypothetical protein [Mucilaginibacter sp. SP1R1]MBB6149441.1 hypothetical protein [Mucilaginibacter sp. SP1R1]